MKVLILSNNELEVKEIDNTLGTLQQIVGGYIEIPYLSETLAKNGIDVIINDEGKFIEGLRAEIAIVKDGTNEVLDVVMGNCIFASHNDEGDTVSLTDEQIAIVQNELKMEAVLTVNGKSGIAKVLFI